WASPSTRSPTGGEQDVAGRPGPGLGQELGGRVPVLQGGKGLEQRLQVLLAVEAPLAGLAGRDPARG
ncbi:MAG TPA: hypothetical protein VFN05_12970, partial [Actinomycetes bacterium]|nr:hypothetical protein [Actinomycetes bacterium]